MVGTWSGPSFGPLSALGAVASGLGELGRDLVGKWSGPSFEPFSALGAMTSGLGELGRDLVGTWSGPSFGPLSVFVNLPICCLGRQLKPMFIFCCMLWKLFRLVATPKTQRFSKFACLVLPGGSFDLRYIGSQRLLQSSGIYFFQMSCSLLSTSILQISLGALNSGSTRGCKREAGLRPSSRKASQLTRLQPKRGVHPSCRRGAEAHGDAFSQGGPPILSGSFSNSRVCRRSGGVHPSCRGAAAAHWVTAETPASTHLAGELRQLVGL